MLPALDCHALVPYLMARGLLGASHVGPGLRVEEATSHRNRVFRVTTAGGPALFVKQGDVAGELQLLARERRVYGVVADAAGPGVTPRIYAHDDLRGVLIMELIDGAEDLDRGHARRGGVAIRIARELGAVMARVHTIAADRCHRLGDGIAAGPPWILSLHRPDGFAAAQLSRGQAQVTMLIQRFTELADRLSGLESEWRDEGLIHNDLRWSNVLAPVRPGERPRVTIIDWELARVGDPRWDVGTIFAEYLASCFLGRAASGDHVDRARASLAALWRSYAQTAAIEHGRRRAFLTTAARYAGAKLVQTAFELADNQLGVPARSIDLLQASLNILRCPGDAVTDVLGLCDARPDYDA